MRKTKPLYRKKEYNISLFGKNIVFLPHKHFDYEYMRFFRT